MTCTRCGREKPGFIVAIWQVGRVDGNTPAIVAAADRIEMSQPPLVPITLPDPSGDCVFLRQAGETTIKARVADWPLCECEPFTLTAEYPAGGV